MNIKFGHASEQLGTGSSFLNSIKKYTINWKVTEPYTHTQAE